MKKTLLIAALVFCSSAIKLTAQEKMALIPAGKFEMGDHHGFVDPKHGSDELPLHTVRLDSFHIGIYDVTTREYCEFLNSALAQRQIEVRKGGVYLIAGNDLLCDTRASSLSSEVGWDGKKFSVLDKKENHPMVCVRWHGAALYCNWLSAQRRIPVCYNTKTWDCDFNKSGFRLPTEAEWECAARGGQQKPYWNFPFANEADPTKANWPESKNPYRTGPMPWTTPVGYFSTNGFGLYDMAGNVWQWCTDWYNRDYYSYSPSENPPGPATGSPMRDGKTYRCMRGGSWFNGEYGHSRVSNRDPSYFRGPDPVTGLSDPDGPYFHIGFRVVRPVNAESRKVIQQERVKTGNAFVLRSSAMTEGGKMPEEFTGDGAGSTPPLEWSGAPAGTKSYALIMHHTNRGETMSYWVLYNIPGNVQSLPKDVKGVGSPGLSSRGNHAGYTPPHSKGPGLKTYVFTVYALSAPPQITGSPSSESLQAAMKDKILASADLSVSHTRFTTGDASEGPSEPENRPNDSASDARPAQGGGQRPAALIFTLLDLNGDDVIDAEELAKASTLLKKLDKNGDGRLTADEYQLRQTESSGGQGNTTNAGSEERPARMENQGGQKRSGGGGGRLAEHNKTPTSPNPGQTVGVFINSPKAFNGYTLIAPKHNTGIYLINNAGQVVHQWKTSYEPGQAVYLKPNGNLLHPCMTRNHFTGGGEGGRIEEYDWNGNLIWEFPYSTQKYSQHHDIAPLPNGNILMLVAEKKSIADCVAAGWPEDSIESGTLVPDSVVEIQPIYPNSGKVVWEWHVWDHMVQEFDKSKANYGEITGHPELIAIRSRSGPNGFWNHANSIAYNAKLDQIIVSARGQSEIWFIDHSTTTKEAASHTGGKHGKGGDLIYRWGNPASYGRGSTRDAQLNQQHDGEWIPDGYPGAGHVTIFNNGYNRGYSSIEEIVPPLSVNGRYLIESGKAFGPEKSFWHYEAKNRTDFFSSEISGAHRLPNGNTLICAGVIGNLFEVTPTGETVWQYVNPVVRGGILAQGELPGTDVRGHLFNAVFKVHRYAPDYPGLKGRDLTPKGVIELPASQKGQTGMDQANAVAGERPRERERARP